MTEVKKKSDLTPRLVTALVAIPILWVIIFVAPTWVFFLLIAWAGATSTWEFVTITDGHDGALSKWFTVAVGVALLGIWYFLPEHSLAVTVAVPVLVFFFYLFRHSDQSRVGHQIAMGTTGIFYGSALICCAALLHRDTGTAGPFWLLLLLVMVWMSDTGAYFTGRAFGKRKLYPSVSPNKTVEGALGGMASTVGFAFLCNYAFTAFLGDDGYTGSILGAQVHWTWESLSVTQVLILAIPANILGQSGDLAESLIKRSYGVKDSGTVIRGHGGMLDRIDALLFAAPWVYFYFLMIL